MNSIIEYLTGMDAMSDQVIATDLLISAKTGVRNYSIALTETATPEVRMILRNQLRETIGMLEEITAYMIGNGWYHPYNAREQIQLDLKNGRMAINPTAPESLEHGQQEV